MEEEKGSEEWGSGRRDEDEDMRRLCRSNLLLTQSRREYFRAKSAVPRCCPWDAPQAAQTTGDSRLWSPLLSTNARTPVLPAPAPTAWQLHPTPCKSSAAALLETWDCMCLLRVWGGPWSPRKKMLAKRTSKSLYVGRGYDQVKKSDQVSLEDMCSGSLALLLNYWVASRQGLIFSPVRYMSSFMPTCGLLRWGMQPLKCLVYLPWHFRLPSV